MFVNEAIAGLGVLLPDVPREELQGAILGTSGSYLNSLPANIRAAATNTIINALQKVFIPVYVGAAVSLVLSICFTVRSISGLAHDARSF